MTRQATDRATVERLFGASADLLPLWIAEPALPLAPTVVDRLVERAELGWYGYEVRTDPDAGAFHEWMSRRHGWNLDGLATLVSPSIGTSIGAAIELVTEPGDGVILQPPVYTDFKPLVVRPDRRVVRNSLQFDDGHYTMDLAALSEVASSPDTSAMILCNPHNPVGRVWTREELAAVADICAANDVFVISDEIHADIVFDGATFTPFAEVAADSGVRWAALHGPIKTFGLAGVCDSLIVTDDAEFRDGFEALSSRLHLTRNNVFSLAAMDTAYRTGDVWVDELLDLVQENAAVLKSQLPDPVRLVSGDGTYLAWIDFRGLGMDVPELATWLVQEAKLALSPGHWFGREGAGFARMTIAVDLSVIVEAVDRLRSAVR